jgi:hypothetical protein
MVDALHTCKAAQGNEKRSERLCEFVERDAPHTLGFLPRLEKALHCIGHHFLKFDERVSLRGDAATPERIIPARNVAASFQAGFHGEGDFCAHAKLCTHLKSFHAVFATALGKFVSFDLAQKVSRKVL